MKKLEYNIESNRELWQKDLPKVTLKMFSSMGKMVTDFSSLNIADELKKSMGEFMDNGAHWGMVSADILSNMHMHYPDYSNRKNYDWFFGNKKWVVMGEMNSKALTRLSNMCDEVVFITPYSCDYIGLDEESIGDNVTMVYLGYHANMKDIFTMLKAWFNVNDIECYMKNVLNSEVLSLECADYIEQFALPVLCKGEDPFYELNEVYELRAVNGWSQHYALYEVLSKKVKLWREWEHDWSGELHSFLNLAEENQSDTSVLLSERAFSEVAKNGMLQKLEDYMHYFVKRPRCTVWKVTASLNKMTLTAKLLMMNEKEV